MDEVYSSKRIELVNGQIDGLENDNVTKTLICIMLNSIGGRYSDIVVMAPISAISSQLEAIGFRICAIIIDTYIASRKLLSQDLYKGNLSTSITDPFDSTRKLFFVFDSVHCLKISITTS